MKKLIKKWLDIKTEDIRLTNYSYLAETQQDKNGQINEIIRKHAEFSNDLADRVKELELKSNDFCFAYKVNWDNWKPEQSKTYWFVNSKGQICNEVWTGSKKNKLRQEFLGVYPTKELAMKRHDEIKSLKK